MIEFAYHFISVCLTKEWKNCEENRSIIGPPRSKEKQCKEAKEEIDESEGEVATEIANSRMDRLRAREGEGDETRKGGGEGEKIRDATAKSDRAVKITISSLWCAPRTLKWEGPVSVGGIHHRARVTRRYIFLGTRLENRYFM